MLEVEDAIIVLQKLSSEYPILLFIVSNNTDIIGWRKGEPSLIWSSSVKFHVSMERHFDIKGLSLRIGNNIEFHVWKRHVLLFRYLARPKWLIILAVYSMLLLQEFQKSNERLVWDEAKTHAIIDD